MNMYVCVCVYIYIYIYMYVQGLAAHGGRSSAPMHVGKKKRKARSWDSEVERSMPLLECGPSSRDPPQFQNGILLVNKALETLSASPHAALRFQVCGIFWIFFCFWDHERLP